MNTMRTTITASLLLGGLLAGVLVCFAMPSLTGKAYAQQPQSMLNTTSGGKLDVKLEPSVSGNTNYNFKITFLQPKTNTVQVHVDYDLTILKDGSQIFSAAKSTNQQLLHTAEGTVTIPYKFDSTGNYQARVTVYGVVFVPINPENAQFSISVVPEFPSGIIIAAAGFGVLAVTASWRLKRQ